MRRSNLLRLTIRLLRTPCPPLCGGGALGENARNTCTHCVQCGVTPQPSINLETALIRFKRFAQCFFHHRFRRGLPRPQLKADRALMHQH